ncbi:hypothetical protein EYR40_000453 [Pleurotus pulmonarius]|nr:hypothetical protein EYR36_004191 [Pleurotus pulmonarius]KAF4579384.1 hypothetical protein EYR36_001194 [Pleurotus pulmonarius]KAF4603290.1 hypothetical protein EYR38_003703 [Pleurotus pulmonarius]KAF4608109.1 hypothetical protein EYR40_000453 [Pleurotus pulmonarius]
MINSMPTPRVLPSPSLSTANLPYNRNPNDFQIERSPRPVAASKRNTVYGGNSFLESDYLFKETVSRFLVVKDRPTTVSGRIPLDPSHLVLFFRSKTGITHSLDFPIDVDYNTPPALDVLIAACRPHPSSNLDGLDRESLYYPSNLPLTTSLEIANHPILEAIRNTLFPALPTGHYLTVSRDQLEVVAVGGRMDPQPQELRNDGRSATIIVTLPVRFRGGALVVHDPEGGSEKYDGRGGKSGDIEWTAFVADCDYEVETVTKGCRITLTYGVYLKTFGPSGLNPDPLINPSDNFLDLLSPIFNLARGRKIAFYIMNDYEVNPSEVLAEALVPELKGGDSVLYHAMKYYSLVPELHWTAGGYIWPIDKTVELSNEDIPLVTSGHGRKAMGVVNGGHRNSPAMRGAFSTYGDPDADGGEMLRMRVEDSGGIPLADADIVVCTNWDPNAPPAIGKARVPFISGGELERLVVNVLMVVYVA